MFIINLLIIYHTILTRPEEFTKALGRRTPADRVQGTITLTITIIEPTSSPTGELGW